MKHIIELKNIKKNYLMGEVNVTVLRGITLNINKGEFVVIIGPSGSGKSTLMNMIGILDKPSQGSVLLNGKNIAHLDEDKLAILRGKTIGFVFQQFNLIKSMTALENVLLPTLFLEGPDRKERAIELLTKVGLGDRIHHRPTELSGGQQQRVAIARSLINDPEIILADEPTGNLDSASGKSIMQLLHELNQKEDKTIVLITHDVDLITKNTKIVKIKDGKLAK
jgi:putative ABC transport system ATP-binding protein